MPLKINNHSTMNPPPGEENNGYWPPGSIYYAFMTKAEVRDNVRRHGYKPRSDLSTYDLVQLLRHHWCGHLSYGKCTEGELKRFIHDRGLRHCTTKKRGRNSLSRLVEHLVKADKERTFTRFADLPPELRVRIYEIYVVQFTADPVEKPKDPPLTRASHMLREECLPIFYRLCTVRIRFDTCHKVGIELQRASRKVLKKMGAKAEQRFQRISA